MMYKAISILFLTLNFQVIANVVMPRIPVGLFVNGGETDFSKLFIDQKNTIKEQVKKLFDFDKLDHEYTKAYETEAKFEIYWLKNESNWHFIDLNRDGKSELIFQSIATLNNEMEFVEIWSNQTVLYKESGHFIAYKIHPNTNEIILFHHKYPCCSSASHNIDMVRYVRGKIRLRKKYFLARDSEMKGDFFPPKVKYTSNYHYLNNNTPVRWSSNRIMNNASKLSNENKVADYPKATPYWILAKRNGWNYVLMCGEPISNQKGLIRSENFKDVHVFGWIR